jgi:hypothetical protein
MVTITLEEITEEKLNIVQDIVYSNKNVIFYKMDEKLEQLKS